MPQQKNKTVVVGMSGGVDSSVSAYLLKKAGYNVIGLFMKNWEEADECGACTASSDFNDVKRVCEVLEIPYYTVNFSKEYMDKVFNHFIDGLKRGITPNPDILCNREIKFGPFLDFASKIGADFIATGHYCQIKNNKLLKSVDTAKDQTYFLCALNKTQLSKTLFPVGGLLKTEVRKIAKEQNLITHNKPDSTGICFIGERKFNEFLSNYIGDKPGQIKTLDGKIVGTHRGLQYYTIGQSRGLGLGATTENAEKWYVIKKEIASNTLFVSNGECPELFSKSLCAAEFNWISPPPVQNFTCTAKVRYRQPDQESAVEITPAGVYVTFKKPQRAVTPGQWVVLYDAETCLGGGEITEVQP